MKPPVGGTDDLSWCERAGKASWPWMLQSSIRVFEFARGSSPLRIGLLGN